MMFKHLPLTRVARLRGAFTAAFALFVIGSAGIQAANVTYEYDEAGRLRKVTYDNGMVTSYVLDAAGNRSSVVSQQSPGVVQLSASTYSGGEASGQRTITPRYRTSFFSSMTRVFIRAASAFLEPRSLLEI